MNRLAQHFLNSPALARRITKAGDIKARERVLEIGPGKGILTRELLKAGTRVLAIEKDKKLFERLKEKFKVEIENGDLEIINSDVLHFSPEAFPKKYKIISNIPYYITGAILKHFLSSENQPKSIVFLIQKEVADNIAKEKGKENILSLSVKAYGAPQYIETVKKSCFTPAPKVDSAVIKVSDISKNNFKDLDEEKFFKIVKQGFSHKRKKLLTNLSSAYNKEKLKEIFKKLEISESERAENLSLKNWLALSKSI